MAVNTSNLDSSDSDAEAAFELFLETRKVVSTQLLTENGAYKKDQLPDDYGGAVLEIEAVHAIYLSNTTGKTIKLQFQVPEAKDKDDKTGGPYNLDGEEIKAQSGESSEPTEMTSKTPDGLNEQLVKYPEYLIPLCDTWDYF